MYWTQNILAFWGKSWCVTVCILIKKCDWAVVCYGWETSLSLYMWKGWRLTSNASMYENEPWVNLSLYWCSYSAISACVPQNKYKENTGKDAGPSQLPIWPKRENSRWECGYRLVFTFCWYLWWYLFLVVSASFLPVPPLFLRQGRRHTDNTGDCFSWAGVKTENQPNLHIELCLQVLGIITAYVEKVVEICFLWVIW